MLYWADSFKKEASLNLKKKNTEEQDRLESQHNLQQVDQFADTLLDLVILRFLYEETIVFPGVNI